VATAAAIVVIGSCTIAENERPVGIASLQLIGGAIDDGNLAAVALTVRGNVFCTGTLVSPSVILTAAHCIDDAGGDPNITIFFGTDTESEGVSIGVSRSKAHLMWTGSLSNYHDIGMLLMNFPVDPLMPIPLNRTPVVLDQQVTRVGFGIHDRDNPGIDGKKRVGTTNIHYISSVDWFLAGDGELSTCNGDSGGPAFIDVDDTRYIAGVHSFGSSAGNSICVPPDNGDTRVDLYADDFVQPWIQDNDPTCGMDGLCAPIGCIDDPDCTPCGPDGSCTSNCALPDPDCSTSELGDICQADTQCTTGLCVFWQPDPSSKFCSRECDPANDDCPSGMSCELRQPFGYVCYYDDDPPGSVGDSCDIATDCGSYLCESGRCVTRCDLSINLLCTEGFECSTLDDENFYCHALDTGGGCSATDSGTTNSSVLALFALLLVCVRRRRHS